MKNIILLSIFSFMLISFYSAIAQMKTQQHFTYSKTQALIKTNSSIGIRAGIGTDINLGLAYGGGINYLLDLNTNAIEIGIVIFGGHSEETTVEFNTYNEKTDVFVFGVLSNYLFGYKLKKPGLFGIIGLGFAAISVEWEESSPNDISLGTPLPGGGSKQSVDATGAGSVFNLGFGMA